MHQAAKSKYYNDVHDNRHSIGAFAGIWPTKRESMQAFFPVNDTGLDSRSCKRHIGSYDTTSYGQFQV
jgi:hypothetical protein